MDSTELQERIEEQ
ncbi:hypothetical protein TIFTF001_055584 [Ficus carica]|uniref:Uncharacterized protein n=1 Tax=Ficus carica TaxID=3494 RepID=A0AA88ECJ2_FICCA|nr:hypothetical protein TIFTF001_055584 [Ficus carica]